MKVYREERSLRMVGKAWEIRATLRQFSNKSITLQEWLTNYHRSTRE